MLVIVNIGLRAAYFNTDIGEADGLKSSGRKTCLIAAVTAPACI
jgi:hypothetical protein